MLEAGYYRRQALTCLSLARSTRDSDLSSRLLDMATRFLGKAAPSGTDPIAQSAVKSQSTAAAPSRAI
jgi:hypothetical protein